MLSFDVPGWISPEFGGGGGGSYGYGGGYYESGYGGGGGGGGGDELPPLIAFGYTNTIALQQKCANTCGTKEATLTGTTCKCGGEKEPIKTIAPTPTTDQALAPAISTEQLLLIGAAAVGLLLILKRS